MDDLLIKYILEETTSEENHQVQQWLAADAANQAHFNKLQAVWQLAALPQPQLTTDAQQALQRLKQTIQARETVPRTHGIKRMWPRLGVTAATITGIAVLALGAYVWLKQNNPAKEQPPVVHPDTGQQHPLQADTTPTIQPVPPLQTDTIPYVRPHKKKRAAPIPPVQPVRPKKRTQPAKPTDTTHSKKKHPVPSQPAQPVRKRKTAAAPKEPQPVRKHKTAPKHAARGGTTYILKMGMKNWRPLFVAKFEMDLPIHTIVICQKRVAIDAGNGPYNGIGYGV